METSQVTSSQRSIFTVLQSSCDARMSEVVVDSLPITSDIASIVVPPVLRGRKAKETSLTSTIISGEANTTALTLKIAYSTSGKGVSVPAVVLPERQLAKEPRSIREKPSKISEPLNVERLPVDVDNVTEMNDDFCKNCGLRGELICCEKCPVAFHFFCCEPPLNPDNLPEEEWLCAVCQPRQNAMVQEHLNTKPGLLGPPFRQLIELAQRSNPCVFRLPPGLVDQYQEQVRGFKKKPVKAKDFAQDTFCFNCVRTGEIFPILKSVFTIGTKHNGVVVDLDLVYLQSPDHVAASHAAIFMNAVTGQYEIVNECDHSIWIDGVECLRTDKQGFILQQNAVCEIGGLRFLFTQPARLGPAQLT